MRAHFRIGQYKYGSDYIPRLAEVSIYQRIKEFDIWDVVIGDGKTPIKDLPRLANYDIYERVRTLEEEVAKLKNDRRI